MDRARLVIFEDQPVSRLLIKVNLLADGHVILDMPESSEEIDTAIENLSTDQKDCDMVIIGSGEDRGDNAKQITERLDKNGINTKRIGFSMFPLKDMGVQVDYDVSNKNITQLRKAVSSA